MLIRSVTLASFSSLVAAYQPALPGQMQHLPRRFPRWYTTSAARGAPARMAVEAAPIETEILPPPHMPTNEESDRLLKIRHTSAHVMAMAVQKL